MGRALETLTLFERDCMNTFLAAEAKKANDSIDHRIQLLEDKTSQLLELCETAPDEAANWGNTIGLDDDEAKKVFLAKDSSDDSSSDDSSRKGKKTKTKKKGLSRMASIGTVRKINSYLDPAWLMNAPINS